MSEGSANTKSKTKDVASRIDLARVPQDFLVVPNKALANVELVVRSAVLDGVVESGFALVEQDGKTEKLSLKRLAEEFTAVAGLTDASGSGVYADNRFVRIANKLGAGAVVFETVADSSYLVSGAREHYGPDEEGNRKDLMSRVSKSWNADALFKGVLSEVGGHVMLSAPGKPLSDTALIGEGWTECSRFTCDDNIIVEDASFAKAVACGDMLMVNASFGDFAKKAEPLSVSALAADALSIKQSMVDAASKVLATDLETYAAAGDGARIEMFYEMKRKLDGDEKTKRKVFGEFSKYVNFGTAMGMLEALAEHALHRKTMAAPKVKKPRP